MFPLVKQVKIAPGHNLFTAWHAMFRESKHPTTTASLVYEAGNPKLVLCDSLGGRVVGVLGRGFRMEGTHVYLWLIHTDV